METITERIETLIELECLSTNAFSRKVGIDASNLSRMLSGNQSITDRTLRKITNSIGCAFEWLKYGEGEMFPDDGKSDAVTTTNSNNTNTNINDGDTIKSLLSLLEEKDNQISRLLAIIERMQGTQE